MNATALKAAWTALALAAAGCRRPPVWSCNDVANHACSEWNGEPTANGHSGCVQLGGIFARAPCPTANSIGVCTPLSTEQAGSSTKLVFYAPKGASFASMSCARAGGRWSGK